VAIPTDELRRHAVPTPQSPRDRGTRLKRADRGEALERVGRPGLAAEWPRINEFQIQVALREQPCAGLLHVGGDVAQISEHDLAPAIRGEHLVHDVLSLMHVVPPLGCRSGNLLRTAIFNGVGPWLQVA
jgi:hypothetical protein